MSRSATHSILADSGAQNTRWKQQSASRLSRPPVLVAGDELGRRDGGGLIAPQPKDFLRYAAKLLTAGAAAVSCPDVVTAGHRTWCVFTVDNFAGKNAQAVYPFRRATNRYVRGYTRILAPGP